MEKNEDMKKLVKQIVMMALIAVVSMTMGVKTYAADDSAITILKMVTTTEAVEAKVSPQDDAEVFQSFPQGQNLLVVEILEDKWYKIAYQNEYGYVKQAVTVENTVFVEEQTGVEEERQEISDETTVLVEVLEEEQTDTKRTLIWGLIIGILVIAIMAVGVWGKIKEDRKNMEEEEQGDDKEETSEK